MRIPPFGLVVAIAVAALPARFSAGAAPVASKMATLPNCLVSLIEEVKVPAQEMGVLVKLDVKEGDMVAAGDQVAQIEDARATMQLRAATAKLHVAEEQAASDVNVQYSIAASAVAKAEYEQAVDANRRIPGTIPSADVNQRLLTYHRTVWEIEKAKMEKRVAALEAQVAQAEVDAANEGLERRKVKSPLEGQVVELHRHFGEWVQAGDPVMDIVRVNKLWVEGFLNAGDYAAAEIDKQPVRVTVVLAKGRQEVFQGRVTFVSPRVEAGGKFLVRAEVDNRQENGYWLLSSGLNAEMTIQLK